MTNLQQAPEEKSSEVKDWKCEELCLLHKRPECSCPFRRFPHTCPSEKKMGEWFERQNPPAVTVMDESPTSVTGEEWEEEFDQKHPVITIGHHHYRRERYLKSFIRNLLSAQRTHIKQALLGRVKGMMFGGNCLSCTDYSEALDDIISILNEELA